MSTARADDLILAALRESYLKGAVAPVYHWTHIPLLPSILVHGLKDPDEGDSAVSLSRDQTYAPWGANPEKVRLTIDKEAMVRAGHKFKPTVDPQVEGGRYEAEELHHGVIHPKYISKIEVHPGGHELIKNDPGLRAVARHPGYKVGLK